MDDKARSLVRRFACDVLGAHKFDTVTRKHTHQTHVVVLTVKTCEYCGFVDRKAEVHPHATMCGVGKVTPKGESFTRQGESIPSMDRLSMDLGVRGTYEK